MLVFTKQTGRKLPFDSWVPTSTWPIITLWWSLSQPGVHPFMSFSKCSHIHTSTQTSVQQWTISLPLPAGISKLPSLKSGFLHFLHPMHVQGAQRFSQYPICCGNRMKSGKGDPIQGWAPGVSALCSLRGQWPNKSCCWVPVWSGLVEGVRADTMR